MPNTLDNLAADIYTAADTVGRELTGFIPSVSMNSDSVRAAKGDTVRAAFTQAAASFDVDESMTVPEGTDITVDNKILTISKSKAVQIPMTGEDAKHLSNGVGFETVYGDLIAQAMRVLANEVEADLYAEGKANAYQAYGDNATDAFASDSFDLVADARQGLVDNGCPMDDVSLVMGTAAGASLRKVAGLVRANEAGTASVREQGILLPIYGINCRESGGVSIHTSSAAGSYEIDATEAVGQTALTVGGGSTDFVGGDVITIANDSTATQYVVNSHSSDTLININGRGLKEAAADGDAITTEGGTFTHNLAFHRRAMELAVRAPALPEGGDQATDSLIVTDPRSGLVFEVRTYKGYRKSMIEVALAWGVKAWKPDFISSIIHLK
jgi:hypothetical protein